MQSSKKQASLWVHQGLYRVNVQAGLFEQGPTLPGFGFRNLACCALHSDNSMFEYSNLQCTLSQAAVRGP